MILSYTSGSLSELITLYDRGACSSLLLSQLAQYITHSGCFC